MSVHGHKFSACIHNITVIGVCQQFDFDLVKSDVSSNPFNQISR